MTCTVTDAYGKSQTVDVSGGVDPADPYSGYGSQYGYYKDAETGLYLCTFRYYDPTNGRFLNRDPAGYGGGLNTYAYCGGNPVNATDPLGLRRNDHAGEGDEVKTPEEQFHEGVANEPGQDGLTGNVGEPVGSGGGGGPTLGEVIVQFFQGLAGKRGCPDEGEAQPERVRHHTDLDGLRDIESEMKIRVSERNRASHGWGVDVEAEPFGPATGLFGASNRLGAIAQGAYVEFDLPAGFRIHPLGDDILMSGSYGYRIETSVNLPLDSLNPRFVDARPWDQKAMDFFNK